MHISLKKQIHKKKINTYIKCYDIVFFFAIFDLPQKNRQLLNFRVSEDSFFCLSNGKKKSLPINTVSENREPFNCKLEKNKFKTELFSLELGKNSANTQVLDHNKSFSKKLLQPKVKNESLYINNKCFKHLGFPHLPLHGQTILVACQREEEALDLYNKVSLLYKSIFLGGFVKSVFKTRKDLKALLANTERKREIYIFLLKAISANNHKNLKATSLIYCKYICLLKILVCRQKSKNNFLK